MTLKMTDLSLLDLDALFALSYLGEKAHPDDILKLQKRKKILAGNGYRGGYHKVQREKIMQSIEKVKGIKALRCDECVHHARSRTNLKILNYHPVKEFWPKYLGYKLLMRGKKSFQVQIEKILPPAKLYPKKIREKLENTLNELQKIGIIKKWSYVQIDEELLKEHKNWFYYWKILSVKIVIL